MAPPPQDPFGRGRRYEQAVRLMRTRGYSLTRATREAGITRKGFHEVNYERQEATAVRRPSGEIRGWRAFFESELRIQGPAPVFAYNLVSGQPEIPPRVGWGEQMGSLVGSLWHALGEGDVARLREFAGRVLVDGAGRRYKIPSVDTMLAWWYATTDDVHDDIYKLFESDTSRKRSAGGQRAA